MPKLKNVTRAEIDALVNASEDPLMTMHDISDRIEKGYCDDIDNPAQLARHFTAIARAASDLSLGLLAKAALQEMKAETELLIRRERDAKDTK